MKTIGIQALATVAPNRGPGYLAAVFAAAKDRTETTVSLEDSDYDDIAKRFPALSRTRVVTWKTRQPTQGPGTELKRLLAKVGIKAQPNCSCNRRARIMDEHGIEWCERNMDEIVGWLREEATKRKLPFMDAAGRMLVKRAIRNAKRAAEFS